MDNGEIVQIVVDFSNALGNHFQNKFVYLADFATSQPDSQALTAIGNHFGGMYDEVASWIHTSLDDPDVFVDVIEWVVDHWEVVRTVGSLILGTTFTGTADVLPFMDAAVAVARTARPRSRGRKFLPPFGEDAQVGTGLVAACKADLADWVSDYIDNLNVGTQSDLEPGVASVVTGTFLPFVNGFYDDLIGTQRRRRPGYGI